MLCHVSDYARGFGGKYGVQKDRMDKVSAHQGLAPPAGTPGVVERGASALLHGWSQVGSWLGFLEVQTFMSAVKSHRDR